MPNEDMVYQGKIAVPYTWAVGAVGSRFLYELRVNKKIWATKCPACGKVYLPPRKSCPDCFCFIAEWVEVGPNGTLVTYTIVRYASQMHPLPAPFAIGVIKLDGSDTGLIHLVGGVELDKIRSGMRVSPVFALERKGSVLDIQNFTPVS